MPLSGIARKTLYYSLAGGAVLIVVVAIIVIYVFLKKSGNFSSFFISSSQATSSFGSEPVPIGGNCTSNGQCVANAFCAQDGICRVGFGKTFDQVCVDPVSCQVGLFCNAINQCYERSDCDGGPDCSCDADSDCRLGLACQAGTCVEQVVGSDPFPSCTKVAVYRTYDIGGGRGFQLLDSLSGGSAYYPNSEPIWYGCSDGGSGKTPLYGWQNNKTGDFTFSPSKTDSKTGNSDYQLINNGNPMLYVFSSRENNFLLPLYRLVGHSMDWDRDFHTTGLNQLVINDPAWEGDIVYATDNNIESGNIITPNYGLLGYAYLQ